MVQNPFATTTAPVLQITAVKYHASYGLQLNVTVKSVTLTLT